MRKFKGSKPLKIIKRQCQKNGWPWDQSKYDQGGDWVTFNFIHENTVAEVVYDTFNGRFLAKTNNSGEEIITERHENLDGVAWYDALLDFIYEPAKQEAA